MKNKEIESYQYFEPIVERCYIEDKDCFSNLNIEMLSEENAELIISFLTEKKEWQAKLINRIKDIKGLL